VSKISKIGPGFRAFTTREKRAHIPHNYEIRFEIPNALLKKLSHVSQKTAEYDTHYCSPPRAFGID
jgi:hypothetical protein